MNNKGPEWQQYQHEVAAALSELGFATEVEEKVTGVRGTHDIDVTARITAAGITQLWVVECKKWKRAVPKERVLTFSAIVADVGADRGLVFAENGFQAGAIRAAGNTNLTLTSLVDFRQNTADELASIKVRDLQERITLLENKFHSIWDLSQEERDKRVAQYIGPSGFLDLPAGHSAATSHLLACLSQMKEALNAARFNRWPVFYWALDDEAPISVNAWPGLLYITEETVATCERIYDQMESPQRQVKDWRELQSQEITELLAKIRQPKDA
ncbi:restriction endonuclease [Streptomyces sp. NBC_00873]|uniref:restriction endonuclease n=1 Tax=unclassified Streptomyces TaxID=2593676 RepID=UPI003867CBA9|nr:restriction endonuclease [Streptomyces sp. NBC_00873]WTA44486.1 restriction endonuclease [Streptomyces sp. NBC_00842]